jgi:hypothetical protein
MNAQRDEYHSAEEDSDNDSWQDDEEEDFIYDFWHAMDPGSGEFCENFDTIQAMWAQAVETRQAAALIRAARRSERRDLEFAIGEGDENDFAARLRWMASPQTVAEDGTRFPIDFDGLLITQFGLRDFDSHAPGFPAAKAVVELGDAAGCVWSAAAQQLRNWVLDATAGDF